MTDFDQTIKSINEAIYTLGENIIAIFGYMGLALFYLCALIYGLLYRLWMKVVSV